MDQLDKSPLEERDLVDARECLTHLGWGLGSIELVEAELLSKSPRELRAMIVADLLDRKFEAIMRHVPAGGDVGAGAANAYARFAGHLGPGEEEPG